MPTAVSILVLFSLLQAAVPDPPPHSDTNCIAAVFFTGNTSGQLKPCGCTGGQLGGLEKRPAVFNAVDPNRRFILDTGTLVGSASEQDLIKFNILLQAFALLDYDLVNFTKQDIEIAAQLGLLDTLSSSSFAALTGQTRSFTKEFSTPPATVQLTVAAPDSADSIDALFHSGSSDLTKPCFNILILTQHNEQAIEAAAQTGIIDCILLPPQGDEPILLSKAGARPAVISGGRLGKYVGRIDIHVAPDNSLASSFTSIPLTETLPSDAGLVDLYKTYQQLVKDADLLTGHPRFTLPAGLEYVGSRACLFCHDYEYRKWRPSRHADAYATLVKVGSQYDPECILCHVIGLDYVTGFINESRTPEMKDVGCENCHGPGSEHIRTLGAVQTAGPMSVCTDCHTPEHSGEYAANERQYFEKIIHWREPVSRRNVAVPAETRPPEGKAATQQQVPDRAKGSP